jgi:F-type H+-transporting ATPase subunit delta
MSAGASKEQRLAEAARHATVLDDKAEAGARAYAEALVNAAAKAGEVDAVLDELDEILADVLAAHPQFADLLRSPTLPSAEKDRMLVTLFDGRARPIVVNFLRVLNRHGRLELLPAIAREARTLWDRRLGRRSAMIRSAVPLDDQQLAALRERIGRIVGAEAVVRTEVDPSLIGGFVVQLGDDVYDASLRTRLERLRRRLVEEKLRQLRGTLSAAAVEG